MVSLRRRRQQASSPLTDSEIKKLYWCMLGRAPESSDTIEWFRRENATLQQGRAYLGKSDEFKNLHNVQRQFQYYIPEIDVSAAVIKTGRMALVTIVKKEEKHLANMLCSVGPIIDFVVLVDTGSSDKTLHIARKTLESLKIPFHIDEIEFENFGQARNAALQMVPANMEWILVVDADEELVASDYNRWLALIKVGEETDGWQIPRMNFSDLKKRRPLVPYPDYQKRLFRNRILDPIVYGKAVHETPQNVVKWGRAPLNRCEEGITGGPHIHHLGYMEITREAWQKKDDLYTSLASKRYDAPLPRLTLKDTKKDWLRKRWNQFSLLFSRK